jgi:peroxiredoxin
MPKTAKTMKNLTKIFALFILVAVTAVVASAQKQPTVAQNISLTDLQGSAVNLAEYKGKVVVLAFGATWLPLSKQQIAVTNKLGKRYADKDVVIFWVSTDSASLKSKNYSSAEQIAAFAVKNKLTAEVLRDSEGVFALKKYNVDQIPSFVILDKLGKQSAEAFSGLDIESDITPDLTNHIDKLLK